MWIILLCSVVALGVFFERLIYLHKASIRVGELLGGISLLIRSGRLEEALGEIEKSGITTIAFHLEDKLTKVEDFISQKLKKRAKELLGER